MPIRPEVAAAATHIAAVADHGEPPPGNVLLWMRGVLAELGRLANDPFKVVDGLGDMGLPLSAELRACLAHEIGMSSYAVLREAVPLLLLDPEPRLRQAAAKVLE